MGIIWRRLIVALSLTAFAVPLYAQQAPDLKLADEMMKKGRAAEVFALLEPHEDRLAGNIEYDYLLGISALDTGKADRATIAFERVLASNPNFAGARLDLARAYYVQGDLERAKTEFETVLSQNPPEQARQVVIKYLATIEAAQKAKKRQLRAYVEATIGHDSNVNNSGSQAQIAVPALGGLSFTLSPTNLATKDDFVSAGAGISYEEELFDRFGLYAGADVKKRSNFNADIFDNAGSDVRVGAFFGARANQLRVGVSGGRYDLDNRLSRRAEGFNVDWKLQYNPANQLSAFSSYLRTRFVDAASRINSFDQSISGLGWLRILSEGRAAVFVNYLFGGERDVEGRADGAKQLDGIRLGGQMQLRSDLEMFGIAGYQEGRYDRMNAAFLTKRHDKQTDLAFGLNWRFAKDWTLRPQVTWSKNDTNIDIYRYERTEYSFTVRRDIN